jgi:hypothetical protein
MWLNERSQGKRHIPDAWIAVAVAGGAVSWRLR